MAGLKKSKRSSKDTGSPNIVLVLFLITFVISNIIFGLLWYFSLEEKNRALANATTKEKEKTAAQTAARVYQTVADDFSQVLGRTLTAEETNELEEYRKQMLAENSTFGKGEKNIDTYRKQMQANRTELGFDSGKYNTTYDAKYKDEAEKAEKTLAQLKKSQADLASLQNQFKDLQAAQDKFFADATVRLDKDQKVVLRDANKQTDEMTKLIQANTTLNQQIVEQDQQRQKIEKGYKIKIKNLEADLEAKTQERPDAVKGADAREPHALLLDISLGKPLWDDPVGTVTRVDTRNKEVTINIGSAKGVRPDLTFVVFAPSKYVANRAEKQMKGTIEVIRVLGPHASRARITATFYPDDFPMHDGDLLFNMFWGTHVAVTGYPSITGIPSESPSEQQRQLNDFMYLLSRQGMIVDAYLDLTDGQVKGTMTQNTRYLIRGDDLAVNAKDLENKEPGAERAVAVNNGSLAMRKDAIEKGIFVISARNLATVIGYRTGNAAEQVGFRPQLPTAGSVVPTLGGGVGAVGARPAPMPMPEAKENPPEAKEKN